MTALRVVLADDHPVTREGIRNLLAQSIDIEVVGEASGGTDALRLVQELAPDVLLLDMEMPDLKGVEVARQLQAAGSPVRILALSAYDDAEYIRGLLATGASGYLIKEEVPDTIVEAVRGVARGEQGWVSRQVAAKLTAFTQEDSVHNGLTSRETQVLGLVVEGRTNQEIGLALDISVKTVEKHLDGIFTKLDVGSRVEAAVRAVREGLV